MMTFAPTCLVSLVYFLICCGPAQPEVSIRVSPDRSQFFKHESISVKCQEDIKDSTTVKWSVKRQASEMVNETCGSHFGYIKEASCMITMYGVDAGLYWCQSESGEPSPGPGPASIRITVSGGDVILQSPVLPVPEGGNATLRCLSRDQTTGQPSSDLRAADFYRNGSFLSAESTGQMSILRVNKSDGGFYRCSISGLGESPESWVEVTQSSSSSSPSDPCASPSDPCAESSDPCESAEPLMTLTQVVVKILVFTPYVISTFLYFSIRRDRARAAAANARRRRDNDVIMEVAV